MVGMPLACHAPPLLHAVAARAPARTCRRPPLSGINPPRDQEAARLVYRCARGQTWARSLISGVWQVVCYWGGVECAARRGAGRGALQVWSKCGWAARIAGCL